MEKIYYWGCIGLKDVLENGGNYLEYLYDYFVTSPICLILILLSALLPLMIAMVYYFVGCNKLSAVARRSIWFVVALLTMVISGFTSNFVMMSGDNDNSNNAKGIFGYSYKTTDRLVGDANGNEEQINTINEEADSYRAELREHCGVYSIAAKISICNALYSFIWFFLFSLVFKRFTIHGRAIPVTW
ncbi:MAG: hypothetical protein ACI3Y8_09765 [Candidatus Cryptobacteroides sp.]